MAEEIISEDLVFLTDAITEIAIRVFDSVAKNPKLEQRGFHLNLSSYYSKAIHSAFRHYEESLPKLAKQKQLLKWEIADFERKISEIKEQLKGLDYPDPPPPSMNLYRTRRILPCRPGIYFLWVEGKIDYVGQSYDLSKRLKPGAHNVMSKNHRVSYLLLDYDDLNFAESYYIGRMQPPRNFNGPANQEIKKRAESFKKLMNDANKPRFKHVYCSQCGSEFGSGDNGFSSCADHSQLNY